MTQHVFNYNPLSSQATVVLAWAHVWRVLRTANEIAYFLCKFFHLPAAGRHCNALCARVAGRRRRRIGGGGGGGGPLSAT